MKTLRWFVLLVKAYYHVGSMFFWLYVTQLCYRLKLWRLGNAAGERMCSAKWHRDLAVDNLMEHSYGLDTDNWPI